MWSDFYGEIQTFTNSCNCLAWNPAFDEDVMIIVGCCQKSLKPDKPQDSKFALDDKPKDDSLL